MKISIMDRLFLEDNTEVTVIGFGGDNTVQVGYLNLVGEYRRLWVTKDKVSIIRQASYSMNYTIEEEIEEYNWRIYGGKMTAHQKAVMRDMRERDEHFWQWEAKDFVNGRDDGEIRS